MGAVQEGFIAGFDALSTGPRTPARNFPLQVEGYDVSGATHFVCGVDLSSPEKRRVRVFLRDAKEASKTANRATVMHYATDPFKGWTETDYRDRAKLEKANQSLEAKCFTAPGGVLMVQSAFDDSATGAVSAYWLNRIVANGSDVAEGKATVFSPALVSLSRPFVPKENEGGSTYCYCDMLHPEQAKVAKTEAQLNDYVFQALSVAPSAAGGKFLALLRLVEVATGETSSKLLERMAVKGDGGNYANEQPDATIERFWKSMPADFAAGVKAALNDGRIELIVVPGTRYRLVGKTLESLDKPKEKRPGVPWERFIVGDTDRNGFMLATLAVRRFQDDAGQASADEDCFVTSVYPMTSAAEAASLKRVTW